jgi:methylmalonyl-CoA/ethylmalonyl-CoA epimerase
MTTPATVNLSRIGQILLVVHDIRKAVAFYRDTLGMKLLFEIPGAAFFDCGGIRLYLSLPDKPETDHPGSILYYKVEDIHATTAALKSRGVNFLEDPNFTARLSDHDLWLAFFEDLDQNVLALMSEVRRAA